MKTIFTILTSLLFTPCLIAQLGFQSNLISDDTTPNDGVRSVRTTDLDGDGDQDVLSTFRNSGKVVWYENLDGLGNFSYFASD